VNEFARLVLQSGMARSEIATALQISVDTIRRYESGAREAGPRNVMALRGLMASRPHAVAREEPGRGPGYRASFTFIDLFAGIGGLRLGFESAGGECVFTSEWDKYAQQTYRANFPGDGHEIAGDIRAIRAGDIPEHDMLLAGFPCQPFSIAGVSKKNALNRPHGFACDTQGTLFFEVQRIIKDKRPKAFLLENVKNLVNHDKGNTYRTIMNVLKNELGYFVSDRVINARSWVPQHRERILIAGFREECGFSLANLEIPDPAKGPKLGAVLDKSVPEKYTLTSHLWNYLQRYAEKHQAKGNGFGFGLVGPDDIARTLSARYFKDGSEILVRQRANNPRRLTPRECARLMGFDGPGESAFKIPVSDTQAYKQFGNSVCVPAIRAVARHMQPFIEGAATPATRAA
jgi:DNA (cytosine-5)-methyltransferase 1